MADLDPHVMFACEYVRPLMCVPPSRCSPRLFMIPTSLATCCVVVSLERETVETRTLAEATCVRTRRVTQPGPPQRVQSGPPLSLYAARAHRGSVLQHLLAA